VPLLSSVTLPDSPVSMLPLSKRPDCFEVAVWGVESRLVKVTVVPTGTAIVYGS
jgi:hypothetical protein